MRIERVQWASAQFQNLNGRLGPAFGPQAVFAYPLNLLYSHSARRHVEMNCGSHRGKASLCATDSLMTIVSLYMKSVSAVGAEKYVKGTNPNVNLLE